MALLTGQPHPTVAEQALNSARQLLLSIEGAILGYWTDMPQAVCEEFRVKIREELGDWELEDTAPKFDPRPPQLAVDANGYVWRVYQDHYSMCPVNPDNSPIPQPMTFYEPSSRGSANV